MRESEIERNIEKVCVCVWERERDRARERKKEREKERERTESMKNWQTDRDDQQFDLDTEI